MDISQVLTTPLFSRSGANAHLVKSAEEYYRTMFRGRAESWNLRDRHMVDTLQELLRFLDRTRPGARVVVWAHRRKSPKRSRPDCDRTTWAARLAGRRSLIVAALLLSVLACSSQAIPSFPPAKLGTPFGSPDLATTQPSAAEIATAIRARLADGEDPAFGVRSRAEQAELTALYQTGGDVALWIDATGRPSRQARESLRLLRDAHSEGLDPADYRPDTLVMLAETRGTASPSAPRNLPSFDVALSRAMLRYFRHLHLGRIDPRTIGFRWNVPVEGHEFAVLLRSAVDGDHITETVAALRPSLVQYNVLRTMLTRYRSLAADASLGSPSASASTVRPGEPYAELRVLYRQLAMFGDLPTETQSAAVPETYEADLVEGVRRFQIRHGLEPDGILGKGTQAALRVPLAWRVRQIELALERLRWLPDLGDRRLVALNIPMFRLWAWDSVPDTAPTLAMNVIVGRALSTQTPVFDEEMREVIFRPYWNVPRSILRNEILPLLERDPSYLRRQNMEIVRGPGDNAPPVETTAENLELLRRGTLRVRQRPGSHNALGLVKFVFPNQENVYVHGTPAQALFSRSRRDFSHGCVRVENPVALAEWVLKENPEWTRDRIVSAMAGTESAHVSLRRPIQVILFYTTAVVMPEDGTIHFADDIYRHDARLDRALAHRNPSQ